MNQCLNKHIHCVLSGSFGCATTTKKFLIKVNDFIFIVILDMPTSFIEINSKNAINMRLNDLPQIINIDKKSKSLHGSLSKSVLNDKPIFVIFMDAINSKDIDEENDIREDKNFWNCSIITKFKKIWWFFTWPIQLVLSLTIPNPKIYRQMYPLTFLMCITWIGLNTYFIVQMLSIIGEHKFTSF